MTFIHQFTIGIPILSFLDNLEYVDLEIVQDFSIIRSWDQFKDFQHFAQIQLFSGDRPGWLMYSAFSGFMRSGQNEIYEIYEFYEICI